MGLETINASSRPNALNVTWPVGATDATLFGAVHIRNIKVVAKNFQSDTEAFRAWFESTLDDTDPDNIVQFREADNSLLFETFTSTMLLMAAARGGKYTPAQLPLASVTQRGIVQLATLIDSDLENLAVTPEAVRQVSALQSGDVDSNDAVYWSAMLPDGSAATRFWHFPSKALGWISQGFDVEVWIHGSSTFNEGNAARLSYKFMVFASEWVKPHPDRGDRSSQIAYPTGITNDGNFLPVRIYQEKKSTSTALDNRFEVAESMALGLGNDIKKAYCRRALKKG